MSLENYKPFFGPRRDLVNDAAIEMSVFKRGLDISQDPSSLQSSRGDSEDLENLPSHTFRESQVDETVAYRINSPRSIGI